MRKKQIKYNGPSKDIKMKDLSNILNMRIFESDFMKKLYLREKSLSADVLSHRPLGLRNKTKNIFKQNILGYQAKIIINNLITYHNYYHCHHNYDDCKHRGRLDLDTPFVKQSFSL